MTVFTILKDGLAKSVVYCGHLGLNKGCTVAYLTYIFRASNEESRITNVSRCFGKVPSGLAYFNKVCLTLSGDAVRGIPNLLKIFGGVRRIKVYNMERV